MTLAIRLLSLKARYTNKLAGPLYKRYVRTNTALTAISVKFQDLLSLLKSSFHLSLAILFAIKVLTNKPLFLKTIVWHTVIVRHTLSLLHSITPTNTSGLVFKL